jgi:integrase
VRNRLIAFDPCEDVKVQRRRRRGTAEQVIERALSRSRLLPAVPDRHRGIVELAVGCGFRWREAVGLCADALALDRGALRVIRTVIGVARHTSFKRYPKSSAGRRTVPVPAVTLRQIGRDGPFAMSGTPAARILPAQCRSPALTRRRATCMHSGQVMRRAAHAVRPAVLHTAYVTRVQGPA